jgi:hypothetical protein
MMPMKLRTVVYVGKVDIENVPVFSCSKCGNSEVFQEVKQDLKALIHKLGDDPHKQKLLLQDFSAWAEVFVSHSTGGKLDLGKIRPHIEEQINELLDLYTIALRVQDDVWMNELKERLEGLSKEWV